MLTASPVDLTAVVDRVRNRWPTVALAVAVVQPGRPADIVVRGLADIGSGIAAHAGTAFRIASITKTLTAVAAMTLVEHGLVDLDEPVNTYLRGFRLAAVDGTPHAATVRQVLTHTSGLPEVVSLPRAFLPDFGESVAHGTPVPSLDEYYGGTLRAVDAPGEVFRYTNHGPATLGQLVEEVSGLSLGPTCGLGSWTRGGCGAPTSPGPATPPPTGPPATARRRAARVRFRCGTWPLSVQPPPGRRRPT